MRLGISIGIGARGAGNSEPAIITASTAPSLGPLTDGDTVQSAYTAGSYASTAGTIASAVETVTINGTTGALADVVSFDDVVAVSVLVTDSVGNTRTFGAGTQTVQGIAPTLTATDSLSGRTLTITVDSTTGTPTPTTALTTLTLDGSPVSPTSTGSGVWTYEVPDNASSQTVAWTVTASNAAGSDTASGSEAVAANLFAPSPLTAPVISGTKVGETPTVDQAGTYDGVPAPTVLGAFTLDGAAFDPPTELQPADEGKTLAYVEEATNGVTPDATQTVTGTVENPPAFASATGGTVTDITEGGSTFRVHYLTPSDTNFEITAGGDFEAWIVPGGGAGGSSNFRSAGGGSAGKPESTIQTLAPGVYPAVVGLGGVGVYPGYGGDGEASSIFGVTAQPGVGGAESAGAEPGNDGRNGVNGSGASQMSDQGGISTGGGFDGGRGGAIMGDRGTDTGAGGGAGAGQNGGDCPPFGDGSGGDGVLSPITGTSQYYCGGGGGSSNGGQFAGGAGGGGADEAPGVNGLGGGGGGAWGFSEPGANGGNGSIYVKYQIA